MNVPLFRFSVRCDFQLIRSVKTFERKSVRLRIKREIRAPDLLEQVLNHAAGCFRREIIAQQSAVKIVFPRCHVALLCPVCKTVRQIPV